VAELRIWRDLNLQLNPHFGERVLVQPFKRDVQNAEYIRWAKEEAKAAEMRHREGMKDLIAEIMLEGDRRRFGYVETVSLIPRPTSLPLLIALLDLVSPNLKSLEINAPHFHVYRALWRPDIHHTIDMRLLHSGLLCPSLSSISIGRYSLKWAETLLSLCSMAPNLRDLAVDLNHTIFPIGYDGVTPLPRPLPIMAQLRRLGVSFQDQRLEDEYDTDDSDLDEADAYLDHPILWLMSASPFVEELAMEYHGDSSSVPPRLLELAGSMEQLHTLYWAINLRDCLQYRQANQDPFTSLRRLALKDDYGFGCVRGSLRLSSQG
jgi:hypothetical protein